MYFNIIFRITFNHLKNKQTLKWLKFSAIDLDSLRVYDAFEVLEALLDHGKVVQDQILDSCLPSFSQVCFAFEAVWADLLTFMDNESTAN